MKNQLSEIDIIKIEQFCADDAMYNAVRKVLLAGIYYHGVAEQGLPDGKEIVNGAFSLVSQSTNYPIDDEILGQNIKAQWAGLNALKNGLDELRKIKKEVKGVESPYNEAI